MLILNDNGKVKYKSSVRNCCTSYVNVIPFSCALFTQCRLAWPIAPGLGPGITVGSNPTTETNLEHKVRILVLRPSFAGLAQLVEQPPCKR